MELAVEPEEVLNVSAARDLVHQLPEPGHLIQLQRSEAFLYGERLNLLTQLVDLDELSQVQPRHPRAAGRARSSPAPSDSRSLRPSRTGIRLASNRSILGCWPMRVPGSARL